MKVGGWKDWRQKRRLISSVKKVLEKGKRKSVVVAEFKKKKKVDHPELGELHERLTKVIYEYDISLAEALGVVELVKDGLKEDFF